MQTMHLHAGRAISISFSVPNEKEIINCDGSALEEGYRCGGRGRTRTDMRLPSADFESAVAANFTTRPSPVFYRKPSLFAR